MPIVLVTGAAQGIGLATVCKLAKEGYRVYGMVRSHSDTKVLDQAIKNNSKYLSKVVGDVTHSSSIEKIVNSIIEERGCIDIVINNACHVVVGTCETCTIREQQQSMDVNYFGAVRVLQETLPHFRRQQSGLVINISSVAGYEPFPHLESYVAAKYALEGLTESLASHLKPWNIRVALIEPGGVKTKAPRRAPLGSRRLPDTDAYEKYCTHAKQQMIESYDSSLEPSKIADVVSMICKSDKPNLRYPVGDFAIMRAKERFKDFTGDAYVNYKNKLLSDTFLYQHLEK